MITLARSRWRLALLAGVSVAIGCSQPGSQSGLPDDAALRASVDSAADRLLVALRTNDADSFEALLAEDVVMMPPGETVLKGKAAVRAWFDQFLTQLRTSSLTISDREIVLGDDWATEIAGFEWTLTPVAGGPAVVDRGSYIQIWRRAPDGRWLFSREIWNSGPPSTPAGG